MKILIASLLLFTGCLKTTEQVRREQMVVDMNQQVGQNQKVVADMQTRIDELQKQVDSMNGRFEEIEHKSTESSKAEKMGMEATVTQLQEEVAILKSAQETQKTEIKQLSQLVEQQKEFIQKVTKTLGGISSGVSKPRSRYDEANRLYEKGKLSEAKTLYLEILGTEKLGPAQNNLIYFNLGQIEFNNKKYDDALVYFSKIIANYPNSSYAPRSMLFIGKCFKAKEAKAEAKEAFQTLLKNYPKSPQVEMAKKELNEII
jgi:TolA-binding protein